MRRGATPGPGVVGTGVDIVEVERVALALSRRGEGFLARLFSSVETGLAPAGRDRGAFLRHVAGRFAAKEAVLKALGTGLRYGRWREVEVGRDPLGRPVVSLRGRLARVAAERGIAAVSVSISHSRHYAVAMAVASGTATGVPQTPSPGE